MNRHVDTPRDMLFGLLALQNGLIEASQLVAAFHSWTNERERSMAEILVSRGALDDAQRNLLEGLAEQVLNRHEGGAGKKLSAVPAGLSAHEPITEAGEPAHGDAWVRVDAPSTIFASPQGAATASVGASTSVGQRFHIVRPHARGGIGVVYIALDAELNREVALKQIQDRHADNPSSRARFLQEAQITGGLEHPGIVPVYGLGIDDDGRPYYAMRLIRGDSLKQAIAGFHGDRTLVDDPGARSLALRKLLRGFVDVCNAIDYAHGRGVLHRDVKPSNIMVGKHGETLVLDWGLAKAVGRADLAISEEERPLLPSSASGSARTLAGETLGTPAYMSPEQASGDMAHVGPRSDVYSLGATLYCVLTGRPPYVDDDFKDGGLLAAVRRCEFVPPRQRDRSLDPALEAICLKAMKPRPEDRYDSPRALAEDIERWMADEPVLAWREPITDRVRRWLRRRRSAVSALVAAALVAMVGLGVVLAVQARANLDLRLSNERERARFELAMEAIRTFHTGVSEDVLLREKEFDELREKLLRGAREFYHKLERSLEGHADRRSRQALGRAYFELGELTESIGSKEEALAIHRRALQVRQALAKEPGTGAEIRAEEGRSLVAVGMLLLQFGQISQARADVDEARSVLEELVQREPRNSGFQTDLAYCYHRRGALLTETSRPAEALKSHKQALAIRESLARANPVRLDLRREVAWSYSNVGALCTATGRLDEALASHKRALAIREPLAKGDPTADSLQSDLAVTYTNIASLRATRGRYPEALAWYRQALAIRKSLAKAKPNIIAYQRDLAYCCSDIGQLLMTAGYPVEGRASYEQALAIREPLAKANPNVTQIQSDLATSYASIGDLDAASARPVEALAAHEKALAIRDALAKAHPEVLRLQRDLAASHHAIGVLLGGTHHPTEALASYRRAIAIRETLVKTTPALTRLHSDLAISHSYVGDLLLAIGNPAEALGSFERAIGVLEPLTQANPANPSYQIRLADCLKRDGNARNALNRHGEALARYRQAIEILEGLPDRSIHVLYELACCHARLSVAALGAGSGLTVADAEAEVDRALECLREAVAAGYRNGVELRNNPDLNPLRPRAEFQVLVLDVDFPADPFRR